jgi:CheY-like chemotaxis protein
MNHSTSQNHPTSGAARRRRALVVDDDPIARRALEKILSLDGFQVLTAADGLAGLRALVDELLDLDVVVTDVRMPGIDGEELIRRIRQVGGEEDLGIVVVSGAAPDEARLTAMGADAVIGKTADIDAIAAAVDVASRRAVQARALVAIEDG